MGADSGENVPSLIPKHEATPYLVNIKGLQPTDLQLIITSANKTDDIQVSSAFVNASQMRKFILDPDYYLNDIQGIQQFKLRDYDRVQERLARAGKTRDTVTEHDLFMGDPILEVAKLSRDEYVARLDAQTVELTKDAEVNTRKDLVAALDVLESKLTPIEFQRMLTFLGVVKEGDHVQIQEEGEEEILIKALLLGRIGKNLSSEWRKIVSLNVWADPELAEEMAKQGEDIKTEKLKDAVDLHVEIELLIANIRSGSLTRAQILEASYAVLNRVSVNKELEPFLLRRAEKLMKSEDIPTEQLASLLEAL